MRSSWLLLPLVLVLALGAWISGLDTTGDPGVTWLLGAGAFAAASVVLISFLLRRR